MRVGARVRSFVVLRDLCLVRCHRNAFLFLQAMLRVDTGTGMGIEEPRVLSSQELQDMFPGSLLAERLQEQAAVQKRPG